MSQPVLFDLPSIPADPPPPAGTKLSREKRMTLRNTALLAQRIHPITRMALLEDGETCGQCAHLFEWGRSRTYWKCKLNATRGPGTDVRKRWPACVKFEAAETSP